MLRTPNRKQRRQSLTLESGPSMWHVHQNQTEPRDRTRRVVGRNGRPGARDRPGTLVEALFLVIAVSAVAALLAGVVVNTALVVAVAASTVDSHLICEADSASGRANKYALLAAATFEAGMTTAATVDSQPSCQAGSPSWAASGDTLTAATPGSHPICQADSSEPAIGDTVVVIRSSDFPQASQKPLGLDRWIARDKAKHLVVSACLAGLFYQSGRHFLGLGAGDSRRAASVATFAVGVSKEIRDRGHPGSNASFRDLAADGAGILAGLLVFSVVVR